MSDLQRLKRDLGPALENRVQQLMAQLDAADSSVLEEKLSQLLGELRSARIVLNRLQEAKAGIAAAEARLEQGGGEKTRAQLNQLKQDEDRLTGNLSRIVSDLM